MTLHASPAIPATEAALGTAGPVSQPPIIQDMHWSGLGRRARAFRIAHAAWSVVGLASLGYIWACAASGRRNGLLCQGVYGMPLVFAFVLGLSFVPQARWRAQRWGSHFSGWAVPTHAQSVWT